MGTARKGPARKLANKWLTGLSKLNPFVYDISLVSATNLFKMPLKHSPREKVAKRASEKGPG